MLLYIPLGMVFVFGGVVQYLGLFTITQTNMVVISLVALYMLNNWRFIGSSTSIVCLALASVYILTIWSLHGGSSTSLLVYAYYIICFYASYIMAVEAGQVFFSDSERLNDPLFRIITTYLVVQAAVTTLQRVFSFNYMNYSKVDMHEIDAVHGTLYMNSDASLSFISLLFVATMVLTKVRTRLLVISIVASLTIILSGNSSAAKVLIIPLLILVFIYRGAFSRSSVYRPLFVYFMLVCLSAILIFKSIEVQEFYDSILDEIFWSVRLGSLNFHRFSPIADASIFGVEYLGLGLLTYYNPIDKIWMLASGHSTTYVLYYDLGVIGLLLFYASFIAYLYFRLKNLVVTVVFSSMLIAFTFFNFILTDMAFVFTIFFILESQLLKRKKCNKPLIENRII